jgi:histone-lysine N-methyltransferase SETMAR
LIFWDKNGIFLIDYHQKGRTINAKYCVSLLVQLKDILKEKRCGKVTKRILFLHDNVPALVTQKKLAYLGFQCLNHGPCSPDLAPSDCHLFPGLKKMIEKSPFFFRQGCHYCRVVLVGRAKF